MFPELIEILFLLISCFSIGASLDKVAADQNKTPDCGTTTQITETGLNVTHRLQLNTHSECVLKFETKQGYEILMKFTSFIFYNDWDKCTTDYLQFGNGEPHETKKYCTSMPKPFRSNQTKMFIRYVATRDGTLGFSALLESKKSPNPGTICPKDTKIDNDSPHDVSHLLTDGTLQTGSLCTMQLRTDERYVMKVEFKQIDFVRSNGQCTLDYVKFGDTKDNLSNAYCRTSTKLVLSAGNTFIIEYLAKEQGSNGYSATVTRIPKPECDEKISLDNDASVEISHQLDKLNLVYNKLCTTRITAPEGFEIELQFIYFQFPSTSCTKAYVQFGSGEPKDTQKYCGETPYRFFSLEPAMFVRYYVNDRDALGYSASVRRIRLETIDTNSPPTNGQVTKPPSTGTPSKPNPDATDTSNTDQSVTNNKQTSKPSSTTRTHVNPTMLATVLFLLIFF